MSFARLAPSTPPVLSSAGIEAATNIVFRKAWIEMLLYVYLAMIVLCFITFRSWRGGGGGGAVDHHLGAVRGADGGAGIGVKVARCR